MTAAAAFAISTAESTEMPTSATCSAGASLMPSPINPTTCCLSWSARMIRCLCAGESRAKMWVVSKASASSSSVIVSTLPPSRISSAFKPTSRHTLRVTRSLSPVAMRESENDEASAVGFQCAIATGTAPLRNPSAPRLS